MKKRCVQLCAEFSTFCVAVFFTNIIAQYYYNNSKIDNTLPILVYCIRGGFFNLKILQYWILEKIVYNISAIYY